MRKLKLIIQLTYHYLKVVIQTRLSSMLYGKLHYKGKNKRIVV